MSRTTIQLTCADLSSAKTAIEKILSSHKYKEKTVNGENVWKCGVGFWTAVKFVKVEFGAENTIALSGWIKPYGCGEQDLEGFVGAIPKKQILNVFEEIKKALA